MSDGTGTEVFGKGLTRKELEELVTQIDGKNLQARNCSLDTVKLLLSDLAKTDDPVERKTLVDKALGNIKHHFVHNRDGIIQAIEVVLRGGEVRSFVDGA